MIKRAGVLGQTASGVPSFAMYGEVEPSSSGPVVVFLGNVGRNDTLRALIEY